jgi:exodeoxyribonuclease III
MPKIKLCSWNVNGIRAVQKKGFFEWLEDSGYDMVGIQESKAQPDQLTEEFKATSNYPLTQYNSAERKGYSGTANFIKSKFKPIAIKLGFDITRLSDDFPVLKIDSLEHNKKTTAINYSDFNKQVSPSYIPESIKELAGVTKLKKQELEKQILDFNAEGRIIETQHEFIKDKALIILNIYFPNGGASIERLKFKFEFYELLLAYLQELRKISPYIIVKGDFNTAHKEIDLARPKENLNTTGFMPVERMYLDFLEELGFIDIFRNLNPNQSELYTWWSFRTAARERNIGWRIDYFFISKELETYVSSAEILSNQEGSDHCPISLELSY